MRLLGDRRPALTRVTSCVARPMVIEKRRSGLYGPDIDLWPDDWAASLRTAGRTFRQSFQMIEIQPALALRVRLSCTLQ